MNKRVRVATSNMAIIIALTGCGAVVGGSDPDRVSIEGSDPLILVHHHTSSGMQALLTGRLVYRSTTKCLVIEGIAGSPSSSSVVPLWPQGTKPLIKDGKRGAQMPGSGPILLEDATVNIAGGYVDWTTSTPPGLELPNNCIADVANSGIFEVNPITSAGSYKS
ncbi:hypothetical protein [Nonomuraea sp. NPDC005692]|uniref:hypothetical protein n=1 Tax=Nonomuraea sp. NPDC005692 TaxID=3157168 RepID=UPI0033EF9D28